MRLLSVMLLFVILYCLMNIYEGILNNASPMPAHCQHACKHFTMSVQLDCSTTYKLFSPIILTLSGKKNATKAHTLLYTAVHGLLF